MNSQKTIGKEVTASGISLHLGSESFLKFKPSKPDCGVVFMRVDLPDIPHIKINVKNAMDGTVRRTSVGSRDATIHTIEHVTAALAGLGIDNVIIETNAPEPPAMDGSAMPFVEIIKGAGIIEQDVPKREIKIDKALSVSEGDKEITIVPDDKCKITYVFGVENPFSMTQMVSIELNEETFTKNIAPARTFCFKSEVEALKASGLGKGGSFDNVVVVDNDGIPDHAPRLENEMARHKILDLIGDLYLLGSIPKGHIFAIKSGHDLNVEIIRKIAEAVREKQTKENTPTMKPIEINEIKNILPHRYPFLMLDRVIEFEEGERAVGIKNVTVNEEYFQGHFPQQPIMPGMLQIEALAQLAGVLLFRNKKDDDTLGFFRSVDNVKFRRQVVPGDQLRLEVQVLRLRGHIAKFSGKALVDGDIAVEAEFTIAI
ncbi:UDP-3-O-[3-hydroxymyristoyl] N-acetylglucosamine deacetylase [Candidatus Poribacteria bacterium]|nr:UDP-3-O-[3-hydroxymyristoyl] N-acetylglucosamine deacetylase [Candidatus Poribacteria bacterium]